jgi:hypothetical protein
MSDCVIAIDPGACAAGVAVYRSSTLKHVAVVQGRCWHHTACQVVQWCHQDASAIPSVVVVERPQVYVQRHLKGDPNDLITVALMAGATVMGLRTSATEIIEYLPRTWKGQVPKDIMQRRIKTRMFPSELAIVPDIGRGITHNLYDAVGIGMYYLGRLQKDI